ncbi:MAG TPA: SGNH/GDSL hydrolase family protein [Longimicrobiales bacterium]|nr:SGNH/GDSL hydrolase family protein [Longimicrobiales bacterium]
MQARARALPNITYRYRGVMHDVGSTVTAPPRPSRAALTRTFGAAQAHLRTLSTVRSADVERFGSTALQLGLVLTVIHVFQVEQSFGLTRILPLVFAGFLVNAVLPLAWRRTFLVLLSLGAAWLLFGVEYGTGLIGLGLGLLAVCHLPIRFGARVALLLLAGAVLAGVRAEWIPIPFGRMPRLPTLVLPILGSMFMFRLVVYMYDLRHEKKPATMAERIGYFFMLPNFCFPLFPVVDYSTYRRTYYDRPALDIYEKGVQWIFRGVAHLLLYRIVYLYLVPAPADVQSLGGVVQAMLTTYLLYLRISGQFHLIVGILCLFGHNLPETHRLYFLASSFNDYWRRINIYWKDFMMKLFYYPSLMRARALGVIPAMVIATVVVFAGTWLLHSYQWFWMRGSFPLRATDALFWGILGGLVVINSVREARRGRARTLTRPEVTVRSALSLSARTVGMFVAITVLWSLWSSSTVEEWVTLVAAAGNSGPAAFALLAVALAALIAIGAALQLAGERLRRPAPEGPRPPRWSPVLASAAAAALILVGLPQTRAWLAPPAAGLVASLQDDGLSARDEEMMDRGYYEGLLDADRYTNALATVQALAERPDDWGGAGRVSQVTVPRNDLLDYENRPLYSDVVKLAELNINEFGMRDRAYTLQKPPGVVRIAFLGSSYEAGAGVRDDETYENVVEDRLNRELGEAGVGYEILNFSAAGYTVLHGFLIAEQRAWNFEPDAVLFALHTNEAGGRLLSHLRVIVQRQVANPYPELRELIASTGATADMSEREIERRLQPILPDVARWSLSELAERCRSRGIPCIATFVPTTAQAGGAPADRVAEVMQMAEAAGFTTWTLDGAYGSYSQDQVQLGEWDAHPNVLGHRLLAAGLFDLLVKNPQAWQPQRTDDAAMTAAAQ